MRKHPVRAAVLAALAEDERAMCQIGAELPGEPGLATVAYHLKALADAGLVCREGNRYRLAQRPAAGGERRRGTGSADDQGPSTSEA